ncbi:MAG TPA: hypothetical protein DHW64_12360 [Chitinophagaceae bacterium]|nr:hypothetical protein [Chitinophagaceae bacterium]
MSNALHQKGFFLKQSWFEITDIGLVIKTKTLTSNDEFFMNFEDIGTKIIRSNGGKKGWLIATVVFVILSIGMYVMEQSGGNAEKNAYLFYLIIAIICIVVYLMTYKRSFFLVTNDNSNAIEFLVDKPSKKEIGDFIQILKNRRKEYLSSKYGQLTKLISYEQQYNTLNWLNRSDVFSKEEYEAKLAELNGLFSGSNSIIGFHNR